MSLLFADDVDLLLQLHERRRLGRGRVVRQDDARGLPRLGLVLVDTQAVTAKREPVTSAVGHDRSPRASRTVNLGRGRVVPYPEPKDEAATRIGKANRRSETGPEVRLRSALHRRGHRFRKDSLVRVGSARVRPDIVFTRWKVAVFIDGCFWHGCPDHQRIPKSNRDYWVPKLEANVERDRRVEAALAEGGWHVVRLWEHVGIEQAVAEVEAVIRARQQHVAGTKI